MFQLEIDVAQIIKSSRVEVFNLKGEIVYQSDINTTNSSIDLSNHAAGIYMLKYYSGQAILTKKIVVL